MHHSVVQVMWKLLDDMTWTLAQMYISTFCTMSTYAHLPETPLKLHMAVVPTGEIRRIDKSKAVRIIDKINSEIIEMSNVHALQMLLTCF